MSLVTESFALVQNLLTLAGYGVLLLQFSPWVVVALMLATIPATIAEMRFSKATFRLRNWRSPDSRRLIYLEYVLANDEHAKEVKLFGLGPMFLGRYKGARRALPRRGLQARDAPLGGHDAPRAARDVRVSTAPTGRWRSSRRRGASRSAT